MNKKLKSGIIGHAQVLFGDTIDINLGTSQNAESETMAIGMTELGYKKAKADDYQVVLVFPNLEALNKFRDILDRLEVEQRKERIAQEEAPQKIDFDDVDSNHLVHKHIDPPTFEEAQGEKKKED